MPETPSNKKYYWMRFQQDFFKSLRIKKLRRLAGGDTFTIIYLKLQLLSISNEGYLEYKGVFGDFAEEMAEDIDEDEDNVRITIDYLLSSGLMEQTDENTFFLPYAADNIGSETASAIRVRNYRERQKALQCNTDVTDVKQFCSVEKEIEKEKDKEIDKEIEKDKKKAKKPTVYFPNDEKLDETFKDFIEMRKKIKAPLTDHAIDLAIKKLNDMAKDNDEAIEILEQSIMNSWKGLFPLKKQETKGKIDWESL